jgi:5-(carboxyamino)imidazole ribonucleotide synthase
MILPSSTIGIIGGGQLGRMTAIAAAQMGYRVHTFTPKTPGEYTPAKQVSNKTFFAEYTDKAALEKFARSVDVVTFEFENIPAESIEFLENITLVRPNSQALHITQHRLREKNFLKNAGFPTPKFYHIKSALELIRALKEIPDGVGILKSAEFGYDGKGQIKVSYHGQDLEKIWNESGFKEAVLEEFVKFSKEISVVLSRGTNGDVSIFPIGENQHVNGILDNSTVPANISSEVLRYAEEVAAAIAYELKYIGTMAVEFFVTQDNKLLVNEIAPRPHNSGHWTIDGCTTSQFEQHIRAICGLPFGETKLTAPKIKMQNLIGNDVAKIQDILESPNAKLHLYGKKHAKPGRKMGHVNFLIG